MMLGTGRYSLSIVKRSNYCDLIISDNKDRKPVGAEYNEQISNKDIKCIISFTSAESVEIFMNKLKEIKDFFEVSKWLN